MKSILVLVSILLTTSTTVVFGIPHFRNPFEAVKGCLLYENAPGYNETLEYLATDNFKHVGHTRTSKYIRVGMVGQTDGIIRYGKSRFPYGDAVHEIYLAGEEDQASEINRHTRTSESEYINKLVKNPTTPNILSKTRPLMFRLDVFDNGNVQLTKDGEKRPFLEFNDGNTKEDLDYIAFAQWNHEVFYFYDCPLDIDTFDLDDSVLLKCDLA